MTHEMFLSMEEEKLKNKNYDISALALANMSGYVDKEIKKRVFRKSEFKGLLKERMGICSRKAEIILNTFRDIGCIEIDEDICKLNPVNNSFLKLNFETAKYCVDFLTPLSFKVYCYLFNKYNIHKEYNYREGYYFSKKELLQITGYYYNNRNSEMMETCLQTLVDVGLIEIGEPAFRYGHNGKFRALYKVNARSHSQIVAKKMMKKELSLTSGEIIMELEILKDKGVKKLYNSQFGGDTDIDKLIDMVNVYPTGAQCYLDCSRNKNENKEVYEKYLEEF